MAVAGADSYRIRSSLAVDRGAVDHNVVSRENEFQAYSSRRYIGWPWTIPYTYSMKE